MLLKSRYMCLVGLILTIFLDPITGKRSFGGSHSYPKSGGLSGGGHRPGRLSGGRHRYPSSGGHSYLLSRGSHNYPSRGSYSYPSGGNHGYPSGSHSGGSSYPSSGGAHKYPTSGDSHGYPASGGLSGGGHGYPANKPAGHHTTNVYNNYHYSPPQQISYASPHGGAPVNYPVYRGTPPTYVYQYKDSVSKYGTLLAGLALMNLGTLGVAGYALHQSSQNHGSGGSSSSSYKPTPGEICKFAVKKDNGDYEETKIDCQIISGFILQDMQAQGQTGTNSNITTVTTVTNMPMVNSTNDSEQASTPPPLPGNVLYALLPNGTLVPVNATGINIPGAIGAVANATQNETASNPAASSVVTTTTTTTNTTQVVDALEVKRKPVEVTPGMQCYVIRISSIHKMRKAVPCGLLQAYADKSIHRRNSATQLTPMITIAAAILTYCVAYSIVKL